MKPHYPKSYIVLFAYLKKISKFIFKEKSSMRSYPEHEKHSLHSERAGMLCAGCGLMTCKEPAEEPAVSLRPQTTVLGFACT